MSHPPSCSAWNRLPSHALLITTIAFLVLASPARAGIGDLVKKAKDKAAKAVGQEAEPEAPADEGKVEYDDVVLELTSDRIERILAAFKTASEVSAGRPPLVERLNKANDERNAVLDKHWEAIQAVRMKRSEVETCCHDGYQAAQDRRTEEYREKALTDPVIREKFTRAAQENNAAAARGDSAAIKRIMQVLHEATAPTRDDSLKVRSACGPTPPRLGSEDRLDALDKEIAALEEKIRQLDMKVAEAQAKEGGLDEAQWAMALERIQMYLSMRRSKSSSSSSKSLARLFSEAEIGALEKHLEQLRAALG